MKINFRIVIGVILLAGTAWCTWLTIEGLRARRLMRMELAEISHVRYGLLNADQWVAKIEPIVNARIDALDLTSSSQASLRPTVENALYRLLDDVKNQMSAKDPKSSGIGGLLGSGNPLIANMIVSGLKPHVPEYAGMVLAELASPENKAALKRYLKTVLADGARSTFGNVDMRWHTNILKQYGCADGTACQQVIAKRIDEAEGTIDKYYLSALAASALAFVLLLTGGPRLGRTATVVLMLFCIVLLFGGIFTPMIEVEARISRLSLTVMGTPVSFADQVLYYQSKSVLEVFHTLVTMGRPDMWFVGVLVLMFSVVFPGLKLMSLGLCLVRPALLRARVVKFLALDSSKWSMADVMAIAIFMAYVAFNGLIGSAMSNLQGAGAQLVLPTNSSKILPGYHLFIGFVLASLFLSKKLERGIRTAENGANELPKA